ncbi:tetratricopeptide repeat protein [Sinorhizobium sp. RAC02]|uniref:tetratricopeptide repeat protein n=1 Tax=Sinorhizobium sp. RAC02 TaxID=1842534 RepID=UPI00083E210B|nr:tetratricopeptide repeat protein [Sinorhizobium sp. RAC02]AOF92279.1 tetratricopeptide repeat family protein [Sinorhizobium sp. RAC02]
MIVPQFRFVMLLAAGLAAFADMSAALAESDADRRVAQDPEIPVATLRQLCRSNSAGTSPEKEIDASAILQQQEKARAACDHLVDAAGLQGRDLAEALLDRADLNAPGEDQAYRSALADYGRAIAVAPGFADAYWRRGKANILYGRNLPAALKDVNEAIRLDASQAEFYVTRASISSWLGEPDAAFADLNQALSYDPRSVHALTNRGLFYLNEGDTARALTDFDAALQLSPSDSGLYSFRAAARREAGDHEGAKADEARMAELMFAEQ